LLAAVELDLFSKIYQGENTEEKLSISLGISALNAERIIVACLGLGLIIKDKNNLKNHKYLSYN
jgi:predicted transcriptional regulator